MTTDPDQIRADVASLLAVLPDPESVDADVEVIAERLEEAHDRLVRALESVETGPAGRSAATREDVAAGRSAATREGVAAGRSAATGGVATPGTGW
jgi:hypothetical protein